MASPFAGYYADMNASHVEQTSTTAGGGAVLNGCPRIITVEGDVATFSGSDDGETWWGEDGSITGKIEGNVVIVDFSSKGGPAACKAEITAGGNISWGDNWWMREHTFHADFADMAPGHVEQKSTTAGDGEVVAG